MPSVQQFLTKNSMTPVLHPPWSHPDQLFLFPWVKKVFKGKRFARVEEVKLKGIKINEFKTVLSSGKNVSMSALHPVENTLKVTEV